MYVFTLTGKDRRDKPREGKDFVLRCGNTRYPFKKGKLEVNDENGAKLVKVFRYYNFIKVKQVADAQEDMEVAEDIVETVAETPVEQPATVGRSRRKSE